MATRAVWKGAISFGLVHVPVALHSATINTGLDFDWLDKRSLDPVGYRRINKVTGEEIAAENIIKGIEYENGRYVVLTDEEIRAAYPKITQTIAIDSFVPNTQIPFVYLEKPYYLEPINKGEKVYALLRDALLQSRRVGVARVVLQNKQHLAALVPSGQGLVLNLLRWGEEIRSWEDLDLPPEGPQAAGVSGQELAMAKALIEDMRGNWDPHRFSNSFKKEILALVDRKVKAGQLQSAAKPEADAEETIPFGAQILDLGDLLQRSLRHGGTSDTPSNGNIPKGKSRARDLPAKKKAQTPDGTDDTSPHSPGSRKAA
ncbi:Ku domain protein [Polaromonas sp. CG9_12]|nr:Ku domain protein [Polaromonas sp. CG9_12]